MVSREEFGDYKIVAGTDAEIVQELNDDRVSRKDVLGFQRADASTVSILYENSGSQ